MKKGLTKKASSSHQVEKKVWRACENYVIMNYNPWKRKMRQTPLYPIFGKEEEIVEHMMLLCEWVIPVWFGMDAGYKVKKQKITTFDKWSEMVS